jgi:hypothetical protein
MREKGEREGEGRYKFIFDYIAKKLKEEKESMH